MSHDETGFFKSYPVGRPGRRHKLRVLWWLLKAWWYDASIAVHLEVDGVLHIDGNRRSAVVYGCYVDMKGGPIAITDRFENRLNGGV
jgi:hypothetical protein